MAGYAFELAVRGLRRFPKSTALIVATVALGIAACMTTLALLRVVSADPLPGRSQDLYLAWVNTVMARPAQMADCSLNGISCEVHFRRVKLDAAEALSTPRRSIDQTVVAEMTANETSGNGLHAVNQQSILATTSGFVRMFGVHLLYGRDWTPAEGRAGDPVAIIDVHLARKLFGTADAIGHHVRLNTTLFDVVGVMKRFEPEPHFYALDAGTFGIWDNMYVPYIAALDAGLQPTDADACDAGYKPRQDMIAATNPKHCASLAVWVQLDTSKQVAAYRTFLQNYADQQRKALASWGKKPRSELIGLMPWIGREHVVPSSARLDVWLASAFLVLCMLNVMGLLSARFLRRSQEIGIRRALGATRGAIFLQHVLEATIVCVLGGVLAIPLTVLGIWILRHQESNFAGLAHFNAETLGLLIVLSVIVGVLVGLLPAWRAARIEPGLQVKSE